MTVATGPLAQAQPTAGTAGLAANSAAMPPGGGREADMQPHIGVRRVYDDPGSQDGIRVLVDRIWPRGLRKEAARLDEWAKDVAPSTELRKWYGHDPAKFGEFQRRYTAELAGPGPQAALARLRTLAAEGPVTLLTATRDVSHSQAAVLAQLLRQSA
jgi:uncharacterized protein YeaO (DUF488 family)